MKLIISYLLKSVSFDLIKKFEIAILEMVDFALHFVCWQERVIVFVSGVWD